MRFDAQKAINELRINGKLVTSSWPKARDMIEWLVLNGEKFSVDHKDGEFQFVRILEPAA